MVVIRGRVGSHRSRDRGLSCSVARGISPKPGLQAQLPCGRVGLTGAGIAGSAAVWRVGGSHRSWDRGLSCSVARGISPKPGLRAQLRCGRGGLTGAGIVGSAALWLVGSYQSRDRACVFCIGSWILSRWTTGNVPRLPLE